ncbi:WD40-repeat-containing domain protein [Lipomyces chichibuensis]|uniref:WD40-repeat-containing domain protein n=1 Tax=Lipomyces chichibuensis TaxID=1546026 RepID=UPI00334355EB
MSPLSTTVPLFSIQPNFLDVLADVQSGNTQKDSFYISCFVNDKSVHGTVDVYRSGSEVVLRGKDGFDVQVETHKPALTVSCPELNVSNVLIKSPKSQISVHNPKGIETFDISPQGELYVVGGPNGELSLSSITDDGAFTRSLDGHLTYVTKVLFFPSGQVVLSAGGDMQIKLWSAADGSNPRTFLGHKRAVTDLAMIGRGRNFLSASKDGTVKLWECGSGSLIHSFTNPLDIPIEPTTMAVSKRHDGISAAPSSPLEFETDDKLLTIGYDNGDIAIYGLSTKNVLASIPTKSVDSEISHIDVVDDRIFVARGKNSEIWDLRSLTVPLETISLPSPIVGMGASAVNSVAFATQIGTPVIFEDHKVLYYAAGFGDSTIVGVKNRRRSDGIYFAGKNGSIKRY